jgi:hypothetical protein
MTDTVSVGPRIVLTSIEEPVRKLLWILEEEECMSLHFSEELAR